MVYLALPSWDVEGKEQLPGSKSSARAQVSVETSGKVESQQAQKKKGAVSARPCLQHLQALFPVLTTAQGGESYCPHFYRSSKRPPPAKGAGLARGSVRTASSPAPTQRLRGPQVPPSALQPALWPQGEPWVFTSFCPGTSGTRRALARAPSRQLPDGSAVPSGSHVDPRV